MGNSQHQLRDAPTVAVVEDQQLGKEGLQCYSEEAEALAEQEDSDRLADDARRVKADKGIEDEDEVDGDAAAADKDRLAVDSVGRTGVSMGVAAEMAAGSARQYAPWTPVWLEVEELD